MALVSPKASATSPPPIPCHFGQIVSESLYLIRLCSRYLCWPSWGYAPWRSQYFQPSFVFNFLPLFPSGQLVFSERLSLSWPLLRLSCFLLSTISVCISEVFIREAGIFNSLLDGLLQECLYISLLSYKEVIVMDQYFGQPALQRRYVPPPILSILKHWV